MKVLCVSGITRKSGGLFYAVSSLCNALVKAGESVSVYGRTDPFFSADSNAWNKVSLVAYRAIGPLGSSSKIRRLLSQGNGDLVHQHGIWMDDQWAALQWQKKNGRPVVISPHGMLDPWALKNSAWKKKLVGKLFANESLHKATCIHALCRSEADSIRAYGLKNPIAIIPNGVELPEIGDGGSKVEGQRLDDGKKRLLFLGRIHPKKGLSELIKAWSAAKCQTPNALSDWQLIIAGWDDGGYENGLKDLSKDLGIDDSVAFVGSKFGAEKEALLRSVDAFVLPSFSEGLPMSVLEAWAYGLPVVMTDHCNLAEGFKANAALRIEPTVDSIQQGLTRLVGMPAEERDAMGSSGRDLVQSDFSWSKIASDMHRVYEWCLTGQQPPECMEFYTANE
jgi:poly(glycerol-phosphate) alpha-glucosyltransferase